MNVAYVFMQFPARSEAFAAGDLRALRALGVSVSTFSLRPVENSTRRLISAWGLDGLVHTETRNKDGFRGVGYVIQHPLTTWKAVRWLFKNEWRRPTSLAKMIALIPAGFFVAKRIQEGSPDIVHLFWGHYPVVVGRILRLLDPDVRITMFLGAYDLELGLSVSSAMSAEADLVFTHCLVNVPRLESMGVDHEKIKVVYRGIDLDLFSDRGGRVSSVYPRPCRIMFAGRLVPGKNLPLVLHAMKVLVRRFPGAHLVIAGDGPDKEGAQKLTAQLGISEQVTFLGYVVHEELVSVYKKCDILVLPSRCKGERLPNVVKEAMAMGVVPITSDSIGIEELVAHEKDGLVLPLGYDEQDLVAAISWLLESPSKLVQLRYNARSKVESRFDVQQNMRWYIAEWSGVCGVD